MSEQGARVRFSHGSIVNTPFNPRNPHQKSLHTAQARNHFNRLLDGTWVFGEAIVWKQNYFMPVPKQQCSGTQLGSHPSYIVIGYPRQLFTRGSFIERLPVKT